MVQNYSLQGLLKTIKFAIFLVLFITVFSSMSAALSFKEVSIVDRLGSDNALLEQVKINIVDNTQKSLKFTLPAGSFDVKLYNESPQILNNTLEIPLECSECRIEMEYRLADVLKNEKGGIITFSRTLNLPISSGYLKYEVMLPQGYIIVPSTGEPSIVPEPTQITTDGTRIILVWNELNPTLPKRYYVMYAGPDYIEGKNPDMISELKEKPVWILMIIMFFIGIVSGYSVSRFKKKELHKVITEIVPGSLLSPDEKKVIELLMGNGHKMGQKEIVQKLEWSKSKVSAVVTNLQYKQMISKEKIGRNYTVELIKGIDK